MFKQNSVWRSVWRGFISMVAFAIPLFVMNLPAEWQSMTIGGVLMALAHFAERKIVTS